MPVLEIDGGQYLFDGISNAGGICKHYDDIAAAFESAADEAELGSIRLLPREGNTGGATTYYDERTGNYYNSFGIPNLGLKAYLAMLGDLLKLAKAAGKKLRVNIAGETPQEYAQLAEAVVNVAKHYGLSEWLILVFNSSCPNCWEDGMPPQILAYEPRPLAGTLRGICSVAQGVPIAIKLSPYDKNVSSELVARAQIAREIASAQEDYGSHFELVISNTVPKQRPKLPNGKDAIGVTDGFAGGSGPMLRPYVIDNLHFFSTALPTVPLVAAGGVESGKDVMTYVRYGATKIQIAAALARRQDPKGGVRAPFRLFSDIYEELAPHIVER